MKVLLLGSGALKIGQAGEFDYSGSQAIKALKEEEINVILINPNIATVQTSHGLADKVYFLPVEPHFVQEVIRAEKPDGILLSFGGQTALNCGLNLSKSGVFKKYNVKVLGTSVNSINQTEDRSLFVESLKSIKLKVPKSQAAATLKEAASAAVKIGYPVMIRGGFSLGGQDSGIAMSQKDLEEIAGRALSKTPQILVEEYLKGFKEIEYEIVRDKFDNCITVCNMENFDPMGIHTGESIVVAPSQTLNNFEYHTLREISLKVIRHLKIVGECNIQFALNPKPLGDTSGGPRRATAVSEKIQSTDKHAIKTRTSDGDNSWQDPNELDYRIIEVNARLSRSSALASKATGYPLAYVAAKLALGQSLTKITNSVTKKTIACFEPALDYLVVKLPRWDLSKFIKSEATIGSYMQSVGEVMAIGRKFEEAIQKAVRMLDVNLEGLTDKKAKKIDFEKPTPWRLFSIAQKLKTGESSQKINKLTGIDPFFLEKIRNITDLEKKIESSQKLTKDSLTLAKKYGFSDNHIASLISSNPQEIQRLRKKHKIIPVIKQIDTLAAEYPAKTNYLYLTYNGDSDDITRDLRGGPARNSVIILGSGPYRIGSSVEFDWCSVNAAQTATNNKIAPIVINCNPETVSTDYDMAERLYFEELTTETVFEIYQKEKPLGIIVSMGGQRPNNLTPDLAKLNLKILGTTPKSIDNAEDRNKFSAMCDKLEINQPPWAMLKTVKDATKFAQKIGFPVLVRPSYVLSGAAMNVAGNREDLKEYLALAANVSEKYPVVISKFMQNAKEIEIDAVAASGRILCHAISEHVENAGVHSGDSTLVLPAQKLYTQTVNEIEVIAQKISTALKITGPFNIQFLAVNNKVSVIECNLRASRSLPFVSKVTGINFAQVATEAILKTGGATGRVPASAQSLYGPLNETRESRRRALAGGKVATGPVGNSYVAVKSPQFSFARIKGADPVLRVEMASTGEVATFGDDIYEAFLKSIIATGTSLPKKSVFISLAGEENKLEFLESTKTLFDLGLKIYATTGTSKFLEKNGITNYRLYKIYEHKKPNVLDVLTAKKVDLVINIFDPYFKKEFDDDYQIRRYTIDFGIPLLVNLQTAELFVKAISVKKLSDLKALPWDYYVKFKD